MYIKIKDPKVLNLKSNESIYFSRNVLDSRYQEYCKPIRPNAKKGPKPPIYIWDKVPIYMGQSP